MTTNPGRYQTAQIPLNIYMWLTPLNNQSRNSSLNFPRYPNMDHKHTSLNSAKRSIKITEFIFLLTALNSSKKWMKRGM